MEINAVDSTTVTLLMVAGAVFAAAGLWLLLKPRPEGTTAKIELFGMKFESSSAGLLVFLIGAVFLVIPLLVPEKAGGPLATAPPGVEGSASGETPARSSASAGGERALVLPEKGAEEREPNNTVHEANQLALGSTARGSGSAARGAADNDESDWYVIDVGATGGLVTVGLRLIDGSGVRANVYDGAERELDELESRGGVAAAEFEAGGTDRLYVRVFPWAWGSNATYDVFSGANAPSGD